MPLTPLPARAVHQPFTIAIYDIVRTAVNALIVDKFQPGDIVETASAAARAGWLLCDGSAISRTTYADLFAAISTTYGVGDGSTTFNLPDLRGRVGVGYAASGGHANVATMGLNDGVTAANRRPKHRHTPHFHTGAGGTGVGTGQRLDGSNTTNSPQDTTSVDGGSGVATDSLDAPAYIVLAKFIKT